jgi:hypothetical protein
LRLQSRKIGITGQRQDDAEAHRTDQ